MLIVLQASLIAHAVEPPHNSFQCQSSESADFTADGKKWQATAKPFSIPVIPGGAIRLKKPGLNFMLEVSLTDEINWEQTQISKAQGFPFEVKIMSDKRSYFDLNLVRISKKKESVLRLNCRRIE
jgi:hypothetical protein